MASPRPADEDEGGELLAAAAGAAVTVAAGRRALGGPADKEVQAGAKEAAERECRQNAPVAVLRVAGGHGVGGGWAVKLLAGQRLSLGRGGGPGGHRVEAADRGAREEQALPTPPALARCERLNPARGRQSSPQVCQLYAEPRPW